MGDAPGLGGMDDGVCWGVVGGCCVTFRHEELVVDYAVGMGFTCCSEFRGARFGRWRRVGEVAIWQKAKVQVARALHLWLASVARVSPRCFPRLRLVHLSVYLVPPSIRCKVRKYASTCLSQGLASRL